MSDKTIGFIGLGLIGGSIAKALRRVHPEYRLIAYNRSRSSLVEAMSDGTINQATDVIDASFAECDFIFLCMPVSVNIQCLKKLKDLVPDTCVITDVGSVKSTIHEAVRELGMEARFIGGHPMTGSEKTGILSATNTLLENAYYIITPTALTPKEEISEFRDFVLSLGAIPLILDYKIHDYSTAAISHLPHMIAYSLVNLIHQIDDDKETMKTIAAGGFKDITRIASSSPVMWQNICASNREPLLSLMDQYLALLTKLRGYIDNSNEQALLSFFQQAKDYRDSITLPSVKSPTVYYECFVDLVDETGGIAAVAGLLAQYHISIKNIGIVNNREFEEGVLQLAFPDKQTLTRAKRLLTDNGYMVHER